MVFKPLEVENTGNINSANDFRASFGSLKSISTVADNSERFESFFKRFKEDEPINKDTITKHLNHINNAGELDIAHYMLSLNDEKLSKDDFFTINQEKGDKSYLRSPIINSLVYRSTYNICDYCKFIGDPIHKKDFFKETTFKKDDGYSLIGKVAAYAVTHSKYDYLEEVINSLGEKTTKKDLADTRINTAEETWVGQGGYNLLVILAQEKPRLLNKIIRSQNETISCADIAYDFSKTNDSLDIAFRNLVLGHRL